MRSARIKTEKGYEPLSYSAIEFVPQIPTQLFLSCNGCPRLPQVLIARLAQETHPRTGRPLLTTASAASLIVFYMFAMQCLSTLAVVRSELKSWGWANSFDEDADKSADRFSSRSGGESLDNISPVRATVLSMDDKTRTESDFIVSLKNDVNADAFDDLDWDDEEE
mgnify:CR=1 FL=1